MTAADVPDPTPDPTPGRTPGPTPEHRQDNGLRALAYVPLTDVEPAVGQHLLTALGRARIAAYLGPQAASADRRRLFVASEERVDARTIVAAAVRALGAEPSGSASDGRASDGRASDGPTADGGASGGPPQDGRPLPGGPTDPLAGIDTDTAFDALVADWHVDTHSAIRDAERDLNREDSDWRARLQRPAADSDAVWLDDDHYVPPPPPPLPRLAAPTIIAMTLLAVSILVLGLGGEMGIAGNLTFVLGIVGLLLGAGILLTRVRNTRRDEDDDGSAL